MTKRQHTTILTLFERFKRTLSKIKKTSSNAGRRIIRTVDARPLQSFLAVLAMLFVIIVVGNVLNRPEQTKEAGTPDPKLVNVYNIGQAPRMQFQAKIEKTGVIKVVAQSPGIVQTIYRTEGQTVSKGQWLVWLSTNYQGGTIPTVSRQLAQKNTEFLKENFQTQKDLIEKRRELANKLDGQNDKLRDITNQSINDTKSVIGINEQLLNSLDSQITYLESTNVGGSNDELIMQAKQAKSGVLSALMSLRSALRNAEYQSGNDNEPAAISNIQKDMTLKQLELEEKSLQLNKELSELNLRIAQISESLMYPASPVSGVIERVYVKPGQTVSPGTPIVSIKGDTSSAQAVVLVTKDIASIVSRIEKSTMMIKNSSVELTPVYISTEATEGSLHTIVYQIPESYVQYVTHLSNTMIDIPVGRVESSSVVPYIPLDSIYQTQSAAYVFVATPSAGNPDILQAESKQITLGQVYGSTVEVINGLTNSDHVIIDRNVIEGDLVKLK